MFRNFIPQEMEPTFRSHARLQWQCTTILILLHHLIYIFISFSVKQNISVCCWSLWAEWFVTKSSLVQRTTRQTYLITWNQVNRDIFPTRESFVNWIAGLFDCGSCKVTVEHWACCLEWHKEGEKHFHVAVKLCGPKGWLSGKNKMFEKHILPVNVSERTVSPVYTSVWTPKIQNICCKSHKKQNNSNWNRHNTT